MSRILIYWSFTLILLVVSDHFVKINCESFFNASLADSFSPAIATWYGDPNGSGSEGGACGFSSDVAQAPYYGMISAGSNNLFKSGKGCGTCYQVKCTDNPACSGKPITVTITDECPGCEAFHFDLSGKAFGFLAKQGLGDKLRNAGRINIQYQRVKCHYNTGLTLKIDGGSNAYYLAFAVEDLNGDGDVGHAEIRPASSNGGNTWISMQQSWGATWRASLPQGTKGPYSVRVTTIESRTTAEAYNIIPADWAPGRVYRSQVNT